MKRSLIVFALLVITIIPTFAQDDDVPVCDTPLVMDAVAADVVMSVDEAQVTTAMFASRVLFEHAYNAVKFEIRVTQINNATEQSGANAAELIASDPQIQQINAENNNPQQLANRVLGEFAADAVVWAYAEAHDIAIMSSDLDMIIDRFFNITEETSDEREIIIDNFSQRLLMGGANSSEILTFFCRQAVYDFVQEDVIEDTDSTLYANVDHILVRSEEVALDIINLLNNGDDFTLLAQDLSLDVASAERGGNLGWQPVVFFVADFARAVRDGEINTILAPVQTQFGWHVIRINGKEERPIADDMRELVISSQFNRWREEEIGNRAISVNPDWQSFIPEL